MPIQLIVESILFSDIFYDIHVIQNPKESTK